MIKRTLSDQIKAHLFQGKAILIMGARQTGKTTLLDHLFDENPDVIWFNGDEYDTQAMFESPSSSRFRTLFAGKKIVVIDEAQRIENIGLKMKLITDQVKDIQLIATGSSSFELSSSVKEPLTGRKWEYMLFPLSFREMAGHHGILEEKRLLPHRLVYGYYPEVVTHPGNEKEVLKQLTDSFLYKDILMWERIKRPDMLIRLLQALAYQTGNQVSANELGSLLGLDRNTVEKYIQLLEQVNVIFRLGSLSRNLRNELKRSRKIYFYDNGIRNALIANFNPPELRQDTGALWENFLMSERLKFISNNNIWVNRYFWRTQEQQEIDYIEEEGGRFSAFEFKWNPKATSRFSKTFLHAYPNSITQTIHQDNFEEFI